MVLGKVGVWLFGFYNWENILEDFVYFILVVILGV